MTTFIDEHPGYDIYSHDILAIDPEGRQIRVLGWDEVRSVSLEELLNECVILGGGTLMLASTFDRVGGYRVGMYNEDYDFWLRALAQGASHLYAPYTLYRYYVRAAGQKTASAIPMYRSAITMFEDLLADYSLTEPQRRIADATVGRYRQLIAEASELGGRTRGQITEDYGASERAAVRSAFGRVMSDGSADPPWGSCKPWRSCSGRSGV